MRRIVMLPRAVQDLEDVIDYLSQFYASTAIKQYDRIVSKIQELPHFPHKYEEYGAGHYRFSYRRMVVDDYLVFYVVLDDAIEIHRILHGKRDIRRYLD
ncbi:plasmid stabilization system [Clostridiales bacterium PH28_bin88]|nr:plasmid stabilization system [Clostridiales bacterium PH28_bin88]